MNTGERLKLARKKLNLTQKELGDSLGVPWHKIKDIESGRLRLPPEMAYEIEQKYSINMKWLLIGVGSMFLEVEKSEIKNTIIDWINHFYETASEKEINWFEVQFEKCFPEFREWKEKRK